MKKIAVILPQYYRGGVLRAAKNFAKTVAYAFNEKNEPAKVVLSVLAGKYDLDDDFYDLKEFNIQVRETNWKNYSSSEAKSILENYNLSSKSVGNTKYCLPSDGMNNFLDCDLWVLITDRLLEPLLPIKKYICVNYDYIQRYVPEIFGTDEDGPWRYQVNSLFDVVRNAEAVVVNTPSTRADLISYAGVPSDHVRMMGIDFEPIVPGSMNVDMDNYYVWVTNSSIHKNHAKTIQGIKKYYEKYGGSLKTVLLGGTTEVFNPKNQKLRSKYDDYARNYFEGISDAIEASSELTRNIIFPGYVSDAEYAAILKKATFLLHSNLYDNGTYSVIEAAYLGTPSLSSNYPPMKFINDELSLNMTFFDQFSSEDLAVSLKKMESRSSSVDLPDKAALEIYNWKTNAEQVYCILKEFI